MLNNKKISTVNAAAKAVYSSPTGVTTKFVPKANNSNTPLNYDTTNVTPVYLRVATQDPHNFFVGSLVTVTGLQQYWYGVGTAVYFIAPIIAKPIVRIDDPYSFCIDHPYEGFSSELRYFDYNNFGGDSGAGYVHPYATAYLVNGQLSSVNIKYAQP